MPRGSGKNVLQKKSIDHVFVKKNEPEKVKDRKTLNPETKKGFLKPYLKILQDFRVSGFRVWWREPKAKAILRSSAAKAEGLSVARAKPERRERSEGRRPER